MLEPTKKPRTEKILLNVVCNMAKLAKVKAALKALECSVKSETRLEPQGPAEKEWYTIDELFPDHHAGHAVKGLRYREDMTQKQLAEAKFDSVTEIRDRLTRDMFSAFETYLDARIRWKLGELKTDGKVKTSQKKFEAAIDNLAEVVDVERDFEVIMLRHFPPNFEMVGLQ